MIRVQQLLELELNFIYLNSLGVFVSGKRGLLDRNMQIGHGEGRISSLVFNSYTLSKDGEQFLRSPTSLELPVIEGHSASSSLNQSVMKLMMMSEFKAVTKSPKQGKVKEYIFFQC